MNDRYPLCPNCCGQLYMSHDTLSLRCSICGKSYGSVREIERINETEAALKEAAAVTPGYLPVSHGKSLETCQLCGALYAPGCDHVCPPTPEHEALGKSVDTLLSFADTMLRFGEAVKQAADAAEHLVKTLKETAEERKDA